MNPNESNLYAGIAGAKVSVDEFDFGHGITLKNTFAHIMAPYLSAFAPAEPGKPHPPPWKAVGGGVSFDIEAELYVPLDFNLPKWFDRVNTIWWFAALLRLRASPLVTIPVIAGESFAKIPSQKQEPYFWPVEMNPTRLVPVRSPAKLIQESDLKWIREHWVSGGMLMSESADLNVAVQAADQCIWSFSPSLALLSLWGALERFFCQSHYEITFRASATIASYLKPPGTERLAYFQHIKKLYDSRSKAAHGTPLNDPTPLIETYDIVRKALMKILEENHVPTREELELRLFGEDRRV